MRIPLAPGGAREMILLTLLLGGGGAAMLAFGPAACPACRVLGVICILGWLAGLAFFRDPSRRTPTDAQALIAPADGKVVETARLEHCEDTGGPATRISIFLSVFDVHVNRSPCAGVVRTVRYKPGSFLDARDPESGRLNEANTIIIEPDPPHAGPIVVRQIAGLIARRIVCSVKEGDRIAAGERIGLIKFGSRTELIVPGHDTYQASVTPGERARGAETILARRTAAQKPGDQAARPMQGAVTCSNP